IEKFVALFLISLFVCLATSLGSAIAFSFFARGSYPDIVGYLIVGSFAALICVVVWGRSIYEAGAKNESDRFLTHVPALRNYISSTMLYAAVAVSLCPILFAAAALAHFL